MEWLFLLIAYIPIISIAISLILLIMGFILRKSKKQTSNVLFAAGGLCIGICLLVYLVLFLIGALGIGPVPN